jgi:mRNA interferase MazF
VKRGEIYRVRRPTGDPKPARSFVIVSRQALVDSNYSTLICAPVFSERLGLSTQVPIGPDEGLKHDSAINCDALVSIDKARLTDFVGSLSVEKLALLEAALAAALSLPA